jgi:predicted 3-demethylubiquinone-9 3-methyltransferase (glyoxalase superfamily)
MQKITPFLWYDKQAGEAAKFYCSVFSAGPSGKNSKIVSSNPMTVTFELEGQKFIALNGGPQFKFTEAISFFVNCETQEEVDYYWEKLCENGGKESQCGWLKDKYGMSWQIIPSILGRLISDPDPVKSQRVINAMLQMKKIDIAKLKKAYENK